MTGTVWSDYRSKMCCKCFMLTVKSVPFTIVGYSKTIMWTVGLYGYLYQMWCLFKKRHLNSPKVTLDSAENMLRIVTVPTLTRHHMELALSSPCPGRRHIAAHSKRVDLFVLQNSSSSLTTPPSLFWSCCPEALCRGVVHWLEFHQSAESCTV